jgi:hypothetical protein
VIVIVMPSRGRPERAAEAIAAIRANAAVVDTTVVLAIDFDDPARPLYEALPVPALYRSEVNLVQLLADETGDLVQATNSVARRIAQQDPTAIIGNLGDDHLVRTPGFDRLIADALREPGIAYGDDLFQGEALPTAPFISASLVNTLGWYFPPFLTHLFVDDAVKAIGTALGCLRYLPELVIEHAHPLIGKADWDEGYERANSQETTDRDRIAYEAWRDGGGLAADLARFAVAA